MKIAIVSTIFWAFLICDYGVVTAQRTFHHTENRLLDTFSLSFNGNLYMARAWEGIWKIIDGLSSFVDLKVIRATVDFVFGYFLPMGSDVENAESRLDVINAEYMVEEQDETFGDASNLRNLATELIGGMFNKQDCFPKLMCRIGKSLQDFKAKDVSFIMAKKTLPDSWQDSVAIAELSSTGTTACNSQYQCDPNVDGRKFN